MSDDMVQLERLKAELLIEVEKEKAKLAAQIKMHESVVLFANAGLKGLFIVNGGGIIAIISYIGNLFSKDSARAQIMAHQSSRAIGFFLFGTTAAVLATGLAYLTQAVFAEMFGVRKGWQTAKAIRICSVVVAISSLISFALGAYRALRALSG